MPNYAVSAIYRNDATAGGIAEGAGGTVHWISIRDNGRWHVSLVEFPSAWGGHEIGAITESIRSALSY